MDHGIGCLLTPVFELFMTWGEIFIFCHRNTWKNKEDYE